MADKLSKEQNEALIDKDTIVIIPEFGAENQIAMRWLQKNCSRAVSEQRVFTELTIPALQNGVKVMVVARDYTMPIQVAELDNANNLRYPNRPAAELEAEVKVTNPVHVSKYWKRDNPMRPGKPDVAGILGALGEETIPWRLEYTDKGNEKPEIMTLVKG